MLAKEAGCFVKVGDRMLMTEPTPAMLEEWKAVFKTYKDRLRPNRKTGAELVEYLSSRYSLTELTDPRALLVVAGNVTENAPFAEKLPEGTFPDPRAFFIDSWGNGRFLYRDRSEQEAVGEIFVGIDLESGYYMVEGSATLWDELCVFQGLDEKDLQNPYCVAMYVNCLERAGRLLDAPE